MKKKVLLMGRSGSGKTSMRSIIFTNHLARDTRRLGATIDVEHSHVRFLDNLVLSLWDCGGQDTFMENYFTAQRDHIFRNVAVLIYVFDVVKFESEKDLAIYQNCLEAMLQNSRDAKIFVLVHKMDLVPPAERDKVVKATSRMIMERSMPLTINLFDTTIWDETLYSAWSSVVNALVPNVATLKGCLDTYCKHWCADEVILFEKSTVLVIASTDIQNFPDVNRFEKISNTIKQFKLICNKLKALPESWTFRFQDFHCYVDGFTHNTFIMVVFTKPHIPRAALQLNIQRARQSFGNVGKSTED